jgi:hypothetical protein
MAVQEALERAIHSVAPTAKIDLGIVDGYLSGTVIATEFDAMTHLERQKSVWSKIRQDLGTLSTEVGMLLLYSPEEANAVEEDQD